jgi:hypothetical protein
MLRQCLLLTLLWTGLAGPALGGYAAALDAACDHGSMAAGNCGSDHDIAAGACSMHCGAAVGIVAAIPGVQPDAAAMLLFARPVLPTGAFARAPATAPPKA